VTISGENLGCATGVFFGNTPAETFSNDQALLDCGSTNSITVTAPPGTIGDTVPVTVSTVESDVTGDTPTTDASFTYTAPPDQTLTVSKTGTGTGSVTSAPAGVDCGATCSNAFAYGTSVTLTATPDSSSTFGGWSGAGCSGTGTCTVNMTAAAAVSATFTANSPPPPPPAKKCVVPKLKGKTLTAAKRSLKSHHCTLGKVKHAFSSNVKKGKVISQKPKAGKHLKHNAKVSVTVSKGKKS
jgi:hypothetical protein